jgi:hypothetical protein
MSTDYQFDQRSLFNCLCYVPSNKFGRLSGNATVAYFRLLSVNFPGGIKEFRIASLRDEIWSQKCPIT